MKKSLYELKLFETVIVSNKNDNVTEFMKKVPGGWVYFTE